MTTALCELARMPRRDHPRSARRSFTRPAAGSADRTVARPGEALGQRTGRGTRAWRDDLQRVGGCSSRCGGPSDRPRTGRGPSPRCTCPAGRCVFADTGKALPSASPHREGTYVRYGCKIMAPWPLCGSHLTREAPFDGVPSALGRPLRPSRGSSTRAGWSRRAMAPASPRSPVDRRQAALSDFIFRARTRRRCHGRRYGPTSSERASRGGWSR